MRKSVQPAFFYALQPKELVADRFYKIFVTERAICGAWLAGQFYDHQSTRAQLMYLGGVIAFLLSPLTNRSIRQRYERERRYETISPDGPDFLPADKRNFRLVPMDVARAVIKRRSRMWTRYWAAGDVLEISTVDGARMRFILVGDLGSERVRELIARIVPNVEFDPRLV